MIFSRAIEDIIADFRGLPRTTTDSLKHEPVPLDKILTIVKEKHNLEIFSPERTIVENWNEIFGNLAGRCNPSSIKDGKTLVISVTNQTLRSELKFKKKSLLKKIQTLPHCENISEILVRA